MSDSINNEIPFVPENTIDPAAGLNEAINVIDALLQLKVLSIGDNAPPGGPTEGDRHIVGDTPTGDWSGQANMLARYLDSAWTFHIAYIAVLGANIYTFNAGAWAPISAATAWGGITGTLASQSDLAAALDSKASVVGAPVVVLAGDTYTVADLTPGAWHVFTSATPVEIAAEPSSDIPDDAEYGLEARGAGGIVLIEDSSTTIIPPKGGTLELEADDFAVLKWTAEDQYKLVGSTVAAS